MYVPAIAFAGVIVPEVVLTGRPVAGNTEKLPPVSPFIVTVTGLFATSSVLHRSAV